MEEQQTPGLRAVLAARVWHGLTALLALAGLVLSAVAAAGASDDTFRLSVTSVLDALTYFTIQSNIIVGATALLLAIRPYGRRSTLFCTFRLDGLIMILITAVVFHAVLASLFDFHGWSSVANQLVHTAVPIFSVVGWLLFGPRGLVTWRVLAWSLLYPILWVVWTLARGAVTYWYPYPFMDAGELGYPRVSLTLLAITAAFVALAAGALALDRLLARRSGAVRAGGRPVAPPTATGRSRRG